MNKDKRIGFCVLLLILLAVAVSFMLLVLRPISMFPDGIARYIPNARQVLQGDISFYSNPLFITFEAFWVLLLKGKALWFAWKLTSFIFFLITAILLTEFMNKTKMKGIEKIIFCSMFLFSTWALLLSNAILQDMLLASLTLAAFICLMNYIERPKWNWAVAVVISIAAILYTKATGYFILAGFFLFVIVKKMRIREKIRCLAMLFTGLISGLPWIMKNQIMTGHGLLGTSQEAAIVVESGKLFQFGTINYWTKFVETFHYFWEIPLPYKTDLASDLLFNICYTSALIVMGFFSIVFLLAIFKYLRKNLDYFMLISPLFGFSVIYWPFITFFDSSDAGRYSFPFFVFMFFFIAKFIAGIKKKNIRIAAYLFVIAFCILSVVSAFGITLQMRNIDSQLLEMLPALEKYKEAGNFVANDMFSATALSFYLEKNVAFNLLGNRRDVNLKCDGELIYSSKNFKTFKEDYEFRICRY